MYSDFYTLLHINNMVSKNLLHPNQLKFGSD